MKKKQAGMKCVVFVVTLLNACDESLLKEKVIVK